MNAVVEPQDPLEGFRELSDEQLETQLRARLGPNAALVDVWQMGIEMKAYTDTPAGALIVKTFTDELHDHLEALLEQADPTSDVAKEHFFEARSRWLALELIQSTITKGIESEKAIVDSDKG